MHVGLLYALMDRVLLGPNAIMASNKGIEPSSLVSSTVNSKYSSMELMY